MDIQTITLILLFGFAAAAIRPGEDFFAVDPANSPSRDSEFLPNGCPSNFSVHLLLPHETNCSMFYNCGNGHRFLMNCSSGLYFDEELQVCNWPSAVKCSKSATESPPGPTVPGPTVPTPPVTPPPVTLPNGCPSNFSVHLLLPHETNCSMFYQCSNGDKYLMNCSAGLYFDVELHVCNWPSAVKCSNSPTESPPGPTVPGPTVPPPPVTPPVTLPNGCPSNFSVHLLLPHETNCSMFYQCSNGDKYLMNCSAGLYFDVELQVCNWPSAVKCSNAPTESPSGPTDPGPTVTEPIITDPPYPPKEICPEGFFGTVPHPDRCDSFYFCFGGCPTQLYCSCGYEFDPSLGKCVEIKEEEGGCTWLKTSTTLASTTETEPTPTICDEIFWIPHPTRCEVFYWYSCATGTWVQVTCGEGLEFDSSIGKCVPIAEGGCTIAGRTIRQIPL